ncbi:MAG TPA: hypothetical protein DF774_07185 [Rheinheimera sp.]|uniref:hypothetical protein n=1 Tax=Rheinheimera sp. TaxID=1869214 RepID=UPI000EEFB90A|nr:hypothetical protein [Rheinheimera sp.]HCU65523.1 hypothetical protein [Rheinheimera sp.]
MNSAKRGIAQEVLIDLYHRLEGLPPRSAQRRDIIAQATALCGISESSLYRHLRNLYQPKSIRRSDAGKPRAIPQAELEQYCEIIAALKIRTMNKNGRHLSTANVIALLERTGVGSDYGFINDEERIVSNDTDPNWLIGKKNRHKGSLHSDIWVGSAAELASRGVLAVYPSLGWWKTRPALERYGQRVRYSLIISIHAPDVDVDLYTPIANMIGVPVVIE